MNKEIEQPAMSCSSDESETDILKIEEVKGMNKDVVSAWKYFYQTIIPNITFEEQITDRFWSNNNFPCF